MSCTRAGDLTVLVHVSIGRLLMHGDLAAIKQFSERIAKSAPKPWLRPLQANLDPPGTSLVRTLHGGLVRGVAVSADGRRAVSASGFNETLQVWDVETGRELRTLGSHSYSFKWVAVSADLRRAVSASKDKTLKVWDVETGCELRTLQGHTDTVRGVALSGDGRRAVSASADKTLKVWDVETGRELRTLEGDSDWVYGVAVSADGRRAISACTGNTAKVRDVDEGTLIATFTCDAVAHCCAFIADDLFIAGDAGGHVHFLNLESRDYRNERGES